MREEKGLTQAQLAEKSGVAAISIHQYESGKREPRIEQLQRIAGALNISISALLDESERTIDFCMSIAKVLGLIKVIYEIDETPPNIKNLIEKQKIDLNTIVSQMGYVAMTAYHPEEMDEIRNSLNEQGWKRVLEFAKEMQQIPKYQRVSTHISAPPPAEPQEDSSVPPDE